MEGENWLVTSIYRDAYTDCWLEKCEVKQLNQFIISKNASVGYNQVLSKMWGIVIPNALLVEV